ncbi:hypothetical protein CTAYLR_005590 [Chrysophaeum taylorii]|uniref:G domain-containing protein n=1 Tax=Chrysophaeum taylorii TaxID=2483200 RepID=A0AAD7U5H7_9STRA|nr:hypothetical protein CTAYLR_005590 [Chrysophaeum taylorii]
MASQKRTRKGRPGLHSQRSALIVTRGKRSGRDAQVKPKQGVVAREGPNLTSVLEAPDSVEAFLERAKEAAIAEEEVVLVRTRAASFSAAAAAAEGRLFEPLAVPRRPSWDEKTSAEELASREDAAFLTWRRGVAEIEEAERSRRAGLASTVATPFERNLEVWRQLWRTLERSDCVFVVVDARWPEFFVPPSLVEYARTLEIPVVVVVNKSDFLRPGQRRAWADYFESDGLECVFFSSKPARDAEEPRVLQPHELLEVGRRPSKRERACIGMVGYPNVGKSTCVNALRGSGHRARAAVSATPGKTKHLQTLLVGDDLELCDCPGLVFPALVANGAAELLCCGVAPLSRARDPVSAARLVASRVPAPVFDLLYGTSCQGKDVLDAYCEARGYKASGSGANDHRRAALDLVRDYLDGTLLYCHPPPDCSDRDAFFADTRTTALETSLRPKLDAKPNNTRAGNVVRAARDAGFDISGVPDSEVEHHPVEPPSATRGHLVTKRANRWGKKGRKFRDPDPYRDTPAISSLLDL